MLSILNRICTYLTITIDLLSWYFLPLLYDHSRLRNLIHYILYNRNIAYNLIINLIINLKPYLRFYIQYNIIQYNRCSKIYKASHKKSHPNSTKQYKSSNLNSNSSNHKPPKNYLLLVPKCSKPNQRKYINLTHNYTYYISQSKTNSKSKVCYKNSLIANILSSST